MAAHPPLTPRQRQVLDAVRAHFATAGYAPTVREIGRSVGLLSTHTVQQHLDTLEAKGYLRRPLRYGNRAIQLVDDAAPVMVEGYPVGRVIPVLRIDIPDTPAAVCAHPRTPANRWAVAGGEGCKPCGRESVAAHLASREVD